MKWLQYAFTLLIAMPTMAQGDNWQRIQSTGTGTATFYWYPNNIQITDSKDIIDGIERDLAESFISFINATYEVEIEMKWVQTKSFSEVLDLVEKGTGGIFGASSISITPERTQRFNFTPPYIADIAVLVSNTTLPIAYSAEDFTRIFTGATAISIPHTTLSRAITQLNVEQHLNLKTEFVRNSGQVIEKIEQTPNGFGYIDLPNFLITFDQSTVRRQFFYPIKGDGLAFIFPLQSDWNEPVQAYFSSDQFQKDRMRLIDSYLGEDIGQIITQISRSAEFGPAEEMVISYREKELQYEELFAASLRERKQTRQNAWLLVTIIGVSIGFVFVGLRNRFKSKANTLLLKKQDEIELRNQQLRQLNEEKNELIHVIAHDLRSPLAMISGGTELLGQNLKLTPEEKQMNLYIQQSVDKMQEMIAKILDVDAVDSGHHNLQIEDFALKPVINQVLSIEKERASQKNISIEMEDFSDVLVHADRFYTAQIIENLVSNAVKFSAAGSRVILGVMRENGSVRMDISDTGPGLTEDDKTKIFKKYQRLSAKPTAGEPSIGLGLSIVKDFVDHMKGDISFESDVGKGTTFTVRLPSNEPF